MYNVLKRAGRDWPVLDEDDVIDYMILEAVTIKAVDEEEQARKQAEMDDWKKDDEGLNELRALAG